MLAMPHMADSTKQPNLALLYGSQFTCMACPFATAFERLDEYAELVAFEHTIFALPFALSTVLLASGPQWPSLITVGWVLLAMIGGRTYAMAANRLLDADIDAKNPRTHQRAIPAGRVSRKEGILLAILSLGTLIFSTSQLPPLCLKLLPIALVVLTGYSLAKRFTHLAHWILGFALGCSAVGGWVAVTGSLHAVPIWIGVAVTFWVSGFDLIYACQDSEFDRTEGLFSIPSALGNAKALAISKLCHALTVVCLGFASLLLWQSGLSAASPIHATGLTMATLLMGGFLVYEHRLVSADNLNQIDAAFFATNGKISVGVFICVLLSHCIALGGWITGGPM